ncbi:MAG: hypothetical protein VKI83_01035 [Synechococcaceae cyanobacterium]|nr:hypothetical protein [Synechococcaceae cyanobacterium]
MSFLRRLLGRMRSSSSDTSLGRPGAVRPGTASAAPPLINLVADEEPVPLPAPASLGIDSTPVPFPWTVSRLERIIRGANARPSDPELLLQARHARYCLSRFWLGAPIDQLESLYASPIGQVQRLLLHGVLRAQPLAGDEAAWKQQLAQRLQDGFEVPERFNLLLAVMPYCDEGQMRLGQPAVQLPSWLIADYATCFDRALLEQLDLPIGLLDPSGAPAVPAAPASRPLAAGHQASEAMPVAAPLRELPVLSEIRGREGFARFQDQDFIDRMNGLINLYLIDRDDPEVLRELQELRRLVAQIWLDATSESLEPLLRSDFGQIYRALLASDLGATPPAGEELDRRRLLTELAGELQHPGCSQALLAVMAFYPQGSMDLGDSQPSRPAWLQQTFAALAGRR